MLDSDGKEVLSFNITPENDPNKKQINAITLIPQKPLLNGKIYTVEIVLKVASGEEKSYKWSFETIGK